MLTTLDIRRILKYVDHFGGVYPLDRLPLVLIKPKSFIINLDPSYKEGSHWVAVIFYKSGHAYYFDAFGRQPTEEILTFIERFASNGYNYSKNKYQDDNSSLCGYYCILFILYGEKRFSSIFKNCKTRMNERKMIKIIKNHFIL